MSNHRLPLGKIAFLAISWIGAFGVVSHSQPPPNDGYENQQRAIRILQFDKDISSLPDAEIRALLRYEILDFVYSKEVRSQYVSAEPVLTAFFEDLKANEKDPGVKVSYLRIRLVASLLKHYPELAERLQTKYSFKADVSGNEYEEIRRGADPAPLVDVAIGKIKAGATFGGTLNLYETVRNRFPELGVRLLNAVIDVAEKSPTPENAAHLNRMMVDVLNPPASAISAEQMSRYHKVLIVAARSELVRSFLKDHFIRTVGPLRKALVQMERSDPRLAIEGRAIFTNYRKFLSKEQVAREEAEDRIEAAEDKLARAISEAENASNPNTKDYIWMRAAQIALPRGKGSRKPSVDLIMKAGPGLGTPENPDHRDQWLKNIAYWASGSQDNDGVKYAIDRIKDEKIRTEALLQYVYEVGRWDVNDRLKTAEQADEVIAQVERIGPTQFTICAVGNLRYLMTRMTGYTNIADFTARTVRIINKASQDGSAAKPGSPERTRYFYFSRDMISCGAWAFRPVDERSPVPPPELADQIKVKEWRIAAQIGAEKYRKYPSAQ